MRDVQLNFNFSSYFISLDEKIYKFPESAKDETVRECNPSINLNKVDCFYKHQDYKITFETSGGNGGKISWFFVSKKLRDKAFDQIEYYIQESIG